MLGLKETLIGSTLGGRYAIDEQLGQGRTGRVYRATDGELGTEVALKILNAPRAPEARERFRQIVAKEVRAASTVRHAHVAAVHAFGTDAEMDVDFVVSELLRGQSLAEVLAQRGKPPIALGLRLLGEAAEGMGAAHAAGLVHRDLRPASVYLVRTEAERHLRVKLAGFGVPQMVRRESLAGAPPEVRGYASPEMLAAGSARLTPAADVYGLGVIGYELITGALPLDAAALDALAEGRRVEIAPPADVAAAVPPPVLDAVMRALRMDPAERFANGSAFAAALREPVSAPMIAVPKIVAEPAPVVAPAAEVTHEPAEAALASAAPEPAPAPVVAEVTAPSAKARSAPPKAPAADLELYYPPQPAKQPVTSAAPPVAPTPVPAMAAEPVAASAPAPAFEEAAPAASPEPVAAAAVEVAVEAMPARAAETVPGQASEEVAARPLKLIGGGERKRRLAAAGGFRAPPAMAAGFVLGILVLGSVAWAATRHGDRPATAAAAAPANPAPVASSAAAPAATDAPAANAAPAPVAEAGTPEAQQAALDAAKKKQQEDEQRRQDAEKARLAALAQQQPGQQLAQAQPVPAPTPAQEPAAPAMRAPQVAVAPQPAAPRPAAVTVAPREEPAAASNQVYEIANVDSRPRLTNPTELQRALQDRYPTQLFAAHVSGPVTATFVVGPDGRVDPSTVRILDSPHPGLNSPTESVLRRARFRPATVKGQPVRVQVTMPVTWTLDQ